jgi:DHA1 family multidrug/chloramphenicol efflux transport protein-like MFS transporter
MGLGFVVAVSYPALQEVFREADAVRLMALLGNVALLSPLLGPLLGSLLLEWLSWRTLFLGLAWRRLLPGWGCMSACPKPSASCATTANNRHPWRSTHGRLGIAI